MEHPAEIAKVLSSVFEEGENAYLFTVLMLDAGLRLGEALGLTWEQIAWGSGANDATHHLRINCNRPRRGAQTQPKPGRARNVALSQRLRAALAHASSLRRTALFSTASNPGG